ITLARGIMPGLPLLASETDSTHHIANPAVPAGMNAKELKKYKGFNDYLKLREKIDRLKKNTQTINPCEIRAAFYVDWDPQSFYSLQKNIDKLNMVLPEWFFIDPSADTLRPDIDLNALQLMKKNKVKIVTLINNINESMAAGKS